MEDRDRRSKSSAKRVSMAIAADATTQVRPRVPHCDLASIARNVEGQCCLLGKILRALHALRAECQAGFERSNSAWSARDSSPKLNDEARITDEDIVDGGGGSSSVASVDMRCPETCPTCGNTVRILLAEIDELRRTRRFMLKVRQEANDILDEVVERALAHPRLQLYTVY